MAETNINVEHSSIDITQLASSIQEKLCHKSPSSASCIFKVPQTLRQESKDDWTAFDPEIVSIGPYHHRLTDGLSHIEKTKQWYLCCLLNRIQGSPPEKSLELFVQKIVESQTRARECYAEPIGIDDNKFVEMMVVDGCFLIELFLKHAENVDGINDDPILSRPWMLEICYEDLILLENQIPWFVLELLFDLIVPRVETAHPPLIELVLKFFEKRMLTTERVAVSRAKEVPEIKHILDLIRLCLLPQSDQMKPENRELEEPSPSALNICLPCPKMVENELKPLPASILTGAGVRFERGTPEDILNIKFKEGVLEIPPIEIQNNSQSLLQNLIAFEQCDCSYTKNHFTSYGLFLNSLIVTREDENMLCSKEILVKPPLVEDIQFDFKRLYNDTPVREFHYAKVTRNVNAYCGARPISGLLYYLFYEVLFTKQAVTKVFIPSATLYLLFLQTVIAFKEEKESSVNETVADAWKLLIRR